MCVFVCINNQIINWPNRLFSIFLWTSFFSLSLSVSLVFSFFLFLNSEIVEGGKCYIESSSSSSSSSFGLLSPYSYIANVFVVVLGNWPAPLIWLSPNDVRLAVKAGDNGIYSPSIHTHTWRGEGNNRHNTTITTGPAQSRAATGLSLGSPTRIQYNYRCTMGFKGPLYFFYFKVLKNLFFFFLSATYPVWASTFCASFFPPTFPFVVPLSLCSCATLSRSYLDCCLYCPYVQRATP